MKQFGLFEAKTHLSKIADMVKRTGQRVTLTKRGQPYVDVVPHGGEVPARRSRKEVVADLEKLRKELPKSSMKQIRADIEEGRH